MIAQWQIDQFHQQGFLVVEEVLSSADIAALQSDFDGWVEESRGHATVWGETLDGRPRFDIERDHAPDHPSLRRVASPTEISEAYRHTALNSRMATIAAQLIGGSGTRFHHSKINSKLPHTATEVKWHQDFLFTPHSNDDIITALLMVSEVTPENGPLNGLAKSMGREAVNIDTRFPNLIPGLQGGRFDITNSSMYITAERLKVIDMVPYLKSGEAILARKGSDYQPKTPEDFCGHKIGSMGATSWLAQLQKLSADYCVKKGLKPIALSVYTTDPQTTQALLSRAVDAQITDAAVARGVVEKLGDRVVISSDTLIYPVLNGFGVKKGNTKVKTALEEALKKYSATPEYAALLKKYHFQAPTADDLQTLMPKAE